MAKKKRYSGKKTDNLPEKKKTGTVNGQTKKYSIAAIAVIVTAVALVYANSLSCPFIFDDEFSVVKNESIRKIWPPDQIFSTPGLGNPVQGRPVLNLSFALNYAISGLDVTGYHIVNIIIHILAALLLFLIARQTLQKGFSDTHLSRNSNYTALTISLLWALHPLTTSTVTYISQRAESLVSLFYLLTIYLVIRSSEASTRKKKILWGTCAVAACALGMASKEVMISAPIITLIYDSLFLSSDVRNTLKRRWPLYLSMAMTWGILAYLVSGTESRGGTAGFGNDSTIIIRYILTQCRALIRYLQLSFWPSGLVFDYGTYMVKSANEVLPFITLTVLLIIATAAGFLFRPKIAFAGIFIFAVLSPSSSLVPVLTQTAAEHRMYLPLAALIFLVVSGISHALQKVFEKVNALSLTRIATAGVLSVTPVLILGNLTVQRNKDYKSEFSIWLDTSRKHPKNARAAMYIGSSILNRNGGNISDKEISEAIEMFDRAIAADPDYALSYANRGLAFYKGKRFNEALEDYSRAIEMKLGRAELFNNRGILLAEMGRTVEAIEDFKSAVNLDPKFSSAHCNLGSAHSKIAGEYSERNELETAEREFRESIVHFTNALSVDSTMVRALKGRAVSYSVLGMHAEAADDCSRIIRLIPDDADAYRDRAICFYNLRRYNEAWNDLETCKRLGGLPNPEFIMMLARERASGDLKPAVPGF